MDPAEFRLKNAARPHSLTANFMELDTVGLAGVHPARLVRFLDGMGSSVS